MNVSQPAVDSFVIECSRQELDILRNAVNNIPQPVDECEYTTLIGATKESTDKLLDSLVEALRKF
jgi:hypothetical protein